MSKFHGLAWFAVIGLMLAADDPKKVPDTIKGTWKAVEFAFDGKTEKAKEDREVKFVITGDKLTVTENNKDAEATYKLDTAKTPITIDITIEKDKLEIKGIVEVDGDSMKLCLALPGGGADRPADFAAKKDSQHVCTTFKREKK